MSEEEERTGPAATAQGRGEEAAPAVDAEGLGRERESEEARRALAEAAVAEWREKALRARADYDNLQRRTARDAQMELERSRARALEGLLPLAELAHMAAHQAQLHPGPLSEGVAMLAREFDRLLGREGVSRIGALGEAVDPARHEVVAQEEVQGVAPGRVSRVVQPGYLFAGKVLRYAKVCVAPEGEGDLAQGRRGAAEGSAGSSGP